MKRKKCYSQAGRAQTDLSFESSRAKQNCIMLCERKRLKTAVVSDIGVSHSQALPCRLHGMRKGDINVLR